MKAIVIGSTKHILFACFYACVGIACAALFASIWYLNSGPALDIWHTTKLKSEFTFRTPIHSFAEYQALEQRLFDEVETQIYQKAPTDNASALNRYVHNSFSDPANWPQNWNRSFEWPLENAQYGVLLLHGMSDSPYALSNIATHYKGRAHVLGLRLPGHGTIPSGLTELYWQDLAAAVSLATAHMKHVLGDKPLYVVGFSTGGALALNHVLAQLQQDNVSDYAAMIMISPAIGLAPIAAGARWQRWIGQLLSLDKLEWNSLQIEYDPFKYTSFAVNAGDVVYRLALHNQALLASMTPQQLKLVPPILTFQSVIDATVSSAAVIDNLYRFLPEGQHQLVLFDINRINVNTDLLIDDPLNAMKATLLQPALPYRLSLIENQSSDTTLVQVHDFGRYTESSPEQLSLAWPPQVYSLSHIALPFAADDSLYGTKVDRKAHRIQIGNAASRGERGMFSVSASEMLRQKYNPFFPYLIRRIDEYLAQQQGSASVLEPTSGNAPIP